MTDQERPTQLGVPVIYATGFSLAASGTDLKVVLTDLTPSQPKEDGNIVGSLQVNGVLTMSMHAAKDLGTLLMSAVHDFEGQFGEITTPYLKGLSTSKE